jgi:mannose-1-phosphate guanylyltransferase
MKNGSKGEAAATKLDQRFAVILAGGEGSRLKSLTRAIAGDERPKQFCTILGERTLLDETRRRTALAIPPENTFFSLTAKHERFFEQSLANVSGRQKVIQPSNRGTAPAILYSLLRVAKASPDATLAFFPSDHYFQDHAAFMRNVESAFAAAEMNTSSVVLLGIEPEKAETSYGWIEPANSFFGDVDRSFSRVSRFWEKPSKNIARRLMAAGGLWNSFVMVGKASTFLDLFSQHLPGIHRMFSAAVGSFGTTDEAPTIRSIYNWIEESNFSSQVLERSAARLLVMRVGGVGWSDWGEPQRVVGTLNMLGVRTEWMQAVAA